MTANDLLKAKPEIHDNVYVRMLSAPVLDANGKVVCKRHPIQEEWKIKHGDIEYNIRHKEVRTIPYHHAYFYQPQSSDKAYDIANNQKEGTHFENHSLAKHNRIWLPSQEQWQEKYMSRRNSDCNLNSKFKCMLEDFIVAVYNQKYEELQDISIKCGDMTILWCLFVSKEVYSLVWDWDKQRWIKI